MAREKEKKTTKKKETKLKIQDIKKSSDVEVSNTINKIKQNEKKVIGGMVLVILLVVALVVCFVFTAFSVERIEGIKSGPLYITFAENENGMSDIVNFTEDDGDPTGDGQLFIQLRLLFLTIRE